MTNHEEHVHNVAALLSRAGATVTHILGVPQPYTESEAAGMLMQQIHQIVRTWVGYEDKNKQETAEGVAYSILGLLSGTNPLFPPFTLVPEVDQEYVNDQTQEGLRYFPPGLRISKPLNDLFKNTDAGDTSLLPKFSGLFDEPLSPNYTDEQVQRLNEDHRMDLTKFGHEMGKIVDVLSQAIPPGRPYEADEISKMIGAAIEKIYLQWLSYHHVEQSERMRGCILEILRMFDGSSLSMPGFMLQPMCAEGEPEMLMQKGYRYFAPGTQVYGRLTQDFERVQESGRQMLVEIEQPYRDMMPGLPPPPPPVQPLDESVLHHRYAPVGNALVNTVTGDAIPKDEPVFIIRAKDTHALNALMHYAARCTDTDQRSDMAKLAGQFVRWRINNPDKVKEPGT